MKEGKRLTPRLRAFLDSMRETLYFIRLTRFRRNRTAHKLPDSGFWPLLRHCACTSGVVSLAAPALTEALALAHT